MTVLNEAKKVYLGSQLVSAVYTNNEKVWPSKSRYEKRILSMNPVSYWRLGEAPGATQSIDQMGLHNANYTGAPILGIPGLLYDDADTSMQVSGGSVQGANAGNPPEYQLYADFTIEAWVKTSNAGASLRSIFVKQNAYSLFTMDNQFMCYEWGSGLMANSGVNIADGKLHHVVAVFGINYGPPESQLYLDGIPVGASFSHTQTNQNGTLAIGYNDYPSQEFNGIIDEVAIYNRRLTATEIRDNYRAGIAPLPWSPADIPGLTTWFDPAQDLFVEGERIASYTEHSDYRRVFLPDSRPEYQPVFHKSPPRIEFPNPCFGMETNNVNLGLTGLTFVIVNQFADYSNYPMMLVSGPDADGWEMRHDGSTMQIVERYSTHSIVFSHSTPDTPGVKNLHILRVQAGARSDTWVNAVLFSGAGAAGHNSPLKLYIAKREGGYYYRGTVSEALVFAGPISDADLTTLVNYLKTKHGL